MNYKYVFIKLNCQVNINKLKKKETSKGDVHLYNSEGKELSPEEEHEELTRYWKTIYQRHPNDIRRVWNSHMREDYEESLNSSAQEEIQYPKHLRELMDMALPSQQGLSKMSPAHISTDDVVAAVAGMKNRTSPGPDRLKPELYKALVETTEGLDALTRCIQHELDAEDKPESWKKSIYISIHIHFSHSSRKWCWFSSSLPQSLHSLSSLFLASNGRVFDLAWKSTIDAGVLSYMGSSFIAGLPAR